MDRDRHDRDTCCQTQKGSGSTEPLRTGRESGAPRSPAKAALGSVGFVYLGVMVLTWAGNRLLMKLALGQVPPLVFVLFRLIGSLTLIAPALLVAGQPLLPARGERSTLFWVGQLSIIGLAILPAGQAIVLAYTMPLWAIPIGLFFVAGTARPGPAHRGGDRLCRPCSLHEP